MGLGMHEQQRRQEVERLDSFRWNGVEIEEEKPDGTKRRASFQGRHAVAVAGLLAGIVAICYLASKDGPWFAYVLVAALAVAGVLGIELKKNGTSEKNREDRPAEPGSDA